MGGQACKCTRGARGEAGDALSSQDAQDMVEKYFGIPASCQDNAKVCLQMKMAYGSTHNMDTNRVIPLVPRPSPYVKGMQVYLPVDDEPQQTGTPTLGITKQTSKCRLADSHPDLPSLMAFPSVALQGKPVIVGTVRMGFGHHRIAYSAVTWALEMGAQPYLVDILAIDSPEAVRVAEMDKAYSKLSRISSNIGGVVDEIWTRMLLQGGVNSLRFSCALAEQLKPLMAGLPKDHPVIAAHPWIGQIAVACGFETVINLVIDNYPQYFVLVPGALNLVQSPSYYSKLLNMGIPSNHLRYAGHWVSRDIAKFAASDSQARIARVQKKLSVRLLIAIGGAGAQQKYVQGFILGMEPWLRNGRVKLFINSGDHGFMADNLTSVFDKEGLEYVLHRSQDDLNNFVVQHQLEKVADPSSDPMITIFNFDTHYAAFRATDLLIRVSDVLATKPSELAFFPIPKLHLRHVGGHESFSAVRSCELGDGTVECTTVELALQHLKLIAEENSPLLLQMNQSIIENDRAHIYEGSKVAVEMAVGGGQASPAAAS
mmetsp:Transcript_34449/g.90938  ORF Transcript_34449/g.90938 Transcript_34449/m.90938 type:complete len:542 (+) Transcript_34449:94-1719(+)